MMSYEYAPLPPLEAAIARQEAKQAPALNILSYAEMAAMPEPEWLVEGVIQKRSTALMFGKSNSFKSFLAIDLGCSVATGTDWHGFETARGRVLFVATEGANGVGRQRVPAWLDHHGIPPADRTGIHLYPQEICLDRPDDVAALIAAMSAIGSFALVVVDIFGGSMAGSEVEDKTGRAWVHGVQRILRETKASVLTVAHTGWQDDTRARMHTHFWGSFDSRMRVEGNKDALTSSLTIERHKDADSTGAWGFRLEKSGGSLVPVMDDTAKPTKSQKLNPQMKLGLRALDDALAGGVVKLPASEWPSCKVVTVEKWREYCYAHHVTDGASDDPEKQAAARRQAFHRIKKGLAERGLITLYKEHVWRCF